MAYESGDHDIVGKGTRRRKFAGYLKAANELRQSYQQQYGSALRDGLKGNGFLSDDEGVSDISMAHDREQELLLFPSYARRHSKKSTGGRQIVPEDQRQTQLGLESIGVTAKSTVSSNDMTTDREYWRREWEKHQDANAVVDVDVRGWLYAPQTKGQMTRKNRILVGIARHLSGLPTPSAASRPSSPTRPVSQSARSDLSELELAASEAQKLEQKGRNEVEFASYGAYSEAPYSTKRNGSTDSSGNSLLSPVSSRQGSPERDEYSRPGLQGQQDSQMSLAQASKTNTASSRNRGSWSQPSDMSAEELAVANAHLMDRLKPFLTTPLVSMRLTIFFYNEETSQSRTVSTNEAGHFAIRAPLDFLPTQVRVLASDKLSTATDVHVIEPHGVSMVSDIDDTIKHSGIGAGAREIFRNVFIRNLDDLAINGVKEWYTRMAQLGVKIHYVSNSPWQLFPVLTKFFSKAGLPQGSFHLKQYTGMLQGIFEPAAERKRGSFDRILDDFPDRQFVLVGDSGEADLELYTDIMLAHPGRILAVFIRDVTSTSFAHIGSSGLQGRAFFDSALRPKSSRSSLKALQRSREADGDATSTRKAPNLPPRPNRSVESSVPPASYDLIDLSEPHDIDTLTQSNYIHDHSTITSQAAQPPFSSHAIPRKPAPPPAPKSRVVHEGNGQGMRSNVLASNGSKRTDGDNALGPSTDGSSQKPIISSARARFEASARTGQSSPIKPSFDYTEPTKRISDTNTSPKRPPLPPRKTLSSYPVAAAQYASARIAEGFSSTPSPNLSPSAEEPPMSGNISGSISSNNTAESPEIIMSRKEEIWRRRWSRASDIFAQKRVILRTWRVGEDVMDECVQIVQKALQAQTAHQGQAGRPPDVPNGHRLPAAARVKP